MQRECAELLMRHMNAIDLLLGGMTHVLDQFPEDEDGPTLRDAIFRTVNDLHAGVSMRVAAQYPDLHPDRKELS
jgi:hypothetical protein